MNRPKERWQTRADRLEWSFAERPVRTGWRVLWWVLGIVLVLALVGTVIGFTSGWGRTAVQVVSPANVQQQYAEIIDDWNSLAKAADNACLVQDGSSGDSDSPTLVEAPAMAYVATFRRIEASYESRWQNVFEAGLVGPPGYPREIPDWPETTGADPDFCRVSSRLAELQAAS